MMDPIAMLQVSMVEDDKPIELTNEEPLEMLEEPPTLEELASCIQLPEEVPDYSEQYPSVNISEDEMVYYNTIFQDLDSIKLKKLHCTSCNVHMGTAPVAQQYRYEHPLLRVLICEQCLNFYSSGDFQRDDDGSELYCRWCGQGGQVFCCASCPFVFCKKCIQRNIGRAMVNHINNSDDWVCYACNPRDIWTLRALAWAVRQYSEFKLSKPPSLRTPEENVEIMTDQSVCCKGQSKGPIQPSATARTKPTSKSRAISPRTTQRRTNSPRMSISSKISTASMSPRTMSPITIGPPEEVEYVPLIPPPPEIITDEYINSLPIVKCPPKPISDSHIPMVLVPQIPKLKAKALTGENQGLWLIENFPRETGSKYPSKNRIVRLHDLEKPGKTSDNPYSLLKPVSFSLFEDLTDKTGKAKRNEQIRIREEITQKMKSIHMNNSVASKKATQKVIPDIISIDDSPPPSPIPPPVIQRSNQFLQVKPRSQLYQSGGKQVPPLVTQKSRPVPQKPIYKTIHYPPSGSSAPVSLATLQNNPVVSEMIQNLQKQVKPGDPQKIIKIVSPDGRAFLIDPMKMPAAEKVTNNYQPIVPKPPQNCPPLQLIRPAAPKSRRVAIMRNDPKWLDAGVAGLQKISQNISNTIVNLVNDAKNPKKNDRIHQYNTFQAHLKFITDSVEKLKQDIRDQYLQSVSTSTNIHQKKAPPPPAANGPSTFGNHFLTFQSEFQNTIFEKDQQLQQRLNNPPQTQYAPNPTRNVAPHEIFGDLPQITGVTTLMDPMVGYEEHQMNGGADVEMNGADDDEYIDMSAMLETAMEVGTSNDAPEPISTIEITGVRSETPEVVISPVNENNKDKVENENEDSSPEKNDTPEEAAKRIKNLKKHLKDIQTEIDKRRKENPKSDESKTVDGEDIFQMDVTCDSDNESVALDNANASDNESVVSISRPVSVYDLNSDSDSDCVLVNEEDALAFDESEINTTADKSDNVAEIDTDETVVNEPEVEVNSTNKRKRSISESDEGNKITKLREIEDVTSKRVSDVSVEGRETEVDTDKDGLKDQDADGSVEKAKEIIKENEEVDQVEGEEIEGQAKVDIKDKVEGEAKDSHKEPDVEVSGKLVSDEIEGSCTEKNETQTTKIDNEVEEPELSSSDLKAPEKASSMDLKTPEKSTSPEKATTDLQTPDKSSSSNLKTLEKSKKSSMNEFGMNDLVSIAKAIRESILESKNPSTSTEKSRAQLDDLEQLLSSNVVFKKGDEQKSPEKQTSPEKPTAGGPSFGDAFSSFIATAATDETESNSDDGKSNEETCTKLSSNEDSGNGTSEETSNSIKELPSTTQSNITIDETSKMNSSKNETSLDTENNDKTGLETKVLEQVSLESNTEDKELLKDTENVEADLEPKVPVEEKDLADKSDGDKNEGKELVEENNGGLDKLTNNSENDGNSEAITSIVPESSEVI